MTAATVVARSWSDWRPIVRLAVTTGVIGVLLVRLGVDPFVEAIYGVQPLLVVAAIAAFVIITVCNALRWHLIGARLAAPVPITRAVPAYFGSQFLNSTLPGGIVGDVHRGVRPYGPGGLARRLRAVAWERALGQIVLVALAAGVFVIVPSPLASRTPWEVRSIVAGTLIVVSVVTVLSVWSSGPGSGGIRGVLAGDLRAICGHGATVGLAALVSLIGIGGHVTVFLLAASSVGIDLAAAKLIPLVLIVLVVGALPLNVAGWGPREGASAWVFSLAGLSASHAVSMSVLYGTLALLATLPGAIALIIQRRGAGHRE